MVRVLRAAAVLLLLSGCAAPRFDGSPVDSSLTCDGHEVVVIMNSATRPGFLEAVEDWLSDNGYNYTVAPDSSQHELDKLTLEYVGRWSWDLAIFLSEAEITAFHQGQRVGRVGYRAPNTFHLAKFGEGSQRIKYMMDVLFGSLSPDEARQRLNSPEQ